MSIYSSLLIGALTVTGIAGAGIGIGLLTNKSGEEKIDIPLTKDQEDTKRQCKNNGNDWVLVWDYWTCKSKKSNNEISQTPQE